MSKRNKPKKAPASRKPAATAATATSSSTTTSSSASPSAKSSGSPSTRKEVRHYSTAQRRALDAYGIEQVCEDITGGASLTDIAKKVGVSKATLLTWIAADSDRSARAKEARRLTAQWWDEAAEREIRAAKKPIDLARARELAFHFRWRASKIAPRDYGEKMELSGDPDRPLSPGVIVSPPLNPPPK